MRKLLKCGVFIILFIIIWNIVFSVLRVQKNSVGLFYDEPKNSMDVMYYGSSSAYAFYSTPLAFSKYGFTTGMLASDGQPFIALKYLIKEAQKYQKPVVNIVDIDCISFDVGDISEGDIRRVVDNIPFSKNKIDLTHSLLDHYQNGEVDNLSYNLSFLYYHSSWKDISLEKMNPSDIYKGSLLNDMTVSIEPQEKLEWIDEEKPLEGDSLDIYLDLIDYIKKEKLETIFVIPKRKVMPSAMKRLNYAIRMANENGIKVINFNNLDDFDVDYNNDFYNQSHLNTTGSIKYTLYLANYLKSNYDLPDHRKDKKYASWNNTYEDYKNQYNKFTNKDYELLVKSIEGEK